MKPIDRIPGFGPTRSAVQTEKGWTVTVIPPAWSGFTKGGSIGLTSEQYLRYLDWLKDGSLIQEVFPELDLDQREILLSGISNEEFDEFAREEDDPATALKPNAE